MKRHPIDWMSLVIAVLSMAGVLYIESTHNDRENAQRISALESHRADDSNRLDRIENKLDKLVDGLLGHK